MASAGGGGEVVESHDDCKQDFGPWFKSQKLLIFFLTDDGQKMVTKTGA
jgi:hypothetical protein